MTLVTFLLTISILTITDLNDNIIPNWLIYPAIAIGCFLTHNWIWAIGMFILGMFLHKDCPVGITTDRIESGDVKLLSMIGAYLGYGSIFVVILGYLLYLSYKKLTQIKDMIPLAPILLVSSIVYIIATKGNSIRTLCLGLNP